MPRISILLFLGCCLWAWPLAAANPGEQAHAAWIAGWQAYAASLESGSDRAQRAANLQAAQRSLVEAAQLEPANPIYAEAAGYVCFQAGDYKSAERHATRARDRARKEPRLRMLLAQVYSYGAYDEPKEARKWAKKAVDELSQAGKLDPSNTNGLLAAASLLVDAGFRDWQQYLAKALQRKELRLYQLPLPEELSPPAAVAIQRQFALAQAARGVNVVRACLRWAGRHPEEAATCFGQGRQVALLLEQATPVWPGVVLAGIGAETQVEQALQATGQGSQERVAKLAEWAQALQPLTQTMPEPGMSLAAFLERQRQAVSEALGGK